MSIESKKENLTRNIKAINDKIEKLETQRSLYQLTLNKLEERLEEGQPANQPSQPGQE